MNRSITNQFIKTDNPIEVSLMKMLYFSTLPSESINQLDELIELYVPDHALEKFQDIENFKKMLNQPPKSISVVLIAAEKEVLNNLQTFQHQLHKLLLVVILPDKSPETVALGCRLHPRFLSYTSGNFSVVKTVLKKHFSNQTPNIMSQSNKGSQSHYQNSSFEKNSVETNLKPKFFKS